MFIRYENTKKAERIAKNHIPVYEHSTDYALTDVYKSPSIYKERAFRFWESECLRRKGRGLKILSHNSQAFTLGFLFDDELTGEIKFCYVTKDYARVCDY